VLLLVTSALALPLLVERFDANALPAGWKSAVALQTGGGKPSEAVVTDGALAITAGPKTKKFTAVSKKLELRDVAYLKVQARVRTEGVDPAAANGVCGVFVRFEGGQMTQAGPCAAADWAPFTRTFVVPEGARDVEVGFLLSTAGTARMDDLLVEPVTPDWKGVNRGGFTYAWLGGDTFREDQLVANDETFDRAVALLGAAPKERVVYRKYANLDAIEEYTGVRAEHVVRPGEIHTVVRTDAYGILEALAPAWGNPPAFLREGLGVAFVGEWAGRDPRQAARALAGDGKAPSLGALLDPKQFAILPADVSYPVAGAFVQWLTATKGNEAVKALYGALKADGSVADNTKALETALGMKLADADAALRAWW
jgi:hypothetical protein